MGRTSPYSEADIRAAVTESISVSEVMARLGMKMAGGSHSNLSHRIKVFGIDTTHFKGQAHNKSNVSPKRKTADEILILRNSSAGRQRTSQLVRALLEIGRPYLCECGTSGEWQRKKLVLQVDHINGNNYDDRRENLRFLCPNCHSQTLNYCRSKPV